MTTMEKPQSNRAKSYNKFNGSQEHGTRGTNHRKFAVKDALRAVVPNEEIEDPAKRQSLHAFMREFARVDTNQKFEDVSIARNRKNKKAEAAADNEIVSGVDDYLGNLSPYELEQEANKLLAVNENRDAALADLEAYIDTVVDAVERGISVNDSNKDNELGHDLSSLLHRFEQAYKRRVELVIDKGTENLSEDEKAELEMLDKTLDGIDEQLTEMLRTQDRAITVGEYDHQTTKEIRDAIARAATLDMFDEDDFGDDYREGKYSNNHIRISNRPR